MQIDIVQTTAQAEHYDEYGICTVTKTKFRII